MNKKNRQNTPDIMGNLMAHEESNKEIRQEGKVLAAQKDYSSDENFVGNKKIKTYRNKEIRTVNNNVINNGGKEKATFNLSLSTLEALEDAWIILRRQLKGQQKITKTLIVETAIKAALDDLHTRGKNGDIHKRLIVTEPGI